MAPFWFSLNFCRLIVECTLNYIFVEPRSCKGDFRWRAESSNSGVVEKSKRDSLFIDKRGKFTSFNFKRLSRKKGNLKTLLAWIWSVCWSVYHLQLSNPGLHRRWFFKGPRMEIWIWFRWWDFSCIGPHCSADSQPCTEGPVFK